jgi:hypothetical protein
VSVSQNFGAPALVSTGPLKGKLAFGAEAALPVVVEKKQPMEFWSWNPRMKMRRASEPIVLGLVGL